MLIVTNLKSVLRKNLYTTTQYHNALIIISAQQ